MVFRLLIHCTLSFIFNVITITIIIIIIISLVLLRNTNTFVKSKKDCNKVVLEMVLDTPRIVDIFKHFQKQN